MILTEEKMLKEIVRFRLSQTVNAYMQMRGWTVNDLTDHLGYKKQQVSQTLSGAIEPSMQLLRRLCVVTNLPASELIETVFEK